MVSPSATLGWTPPHLQAAAPPAPVRTVRRAPVARRWSLRRTHVAVSLVAATTALWLGLTAPSVSPVTPAAPAAVVVAGTATDDAVTGPGGAAVVPAAPTPVTAPHRGGGPGR